MKQIILLALCMAFLMAACTHVTNPQENIQAKIDSMVNARVDSLFNKLKMQNDSIINAKANAKAQEIISGKKM